MSAWEHHHRDVMAALVGQPDHAARDPFRHRDARAAPTSPVSRWDGWPPKPACYPKALWWTNGQQRAGRFACHALRTVTVAFVRRVSKTGAGQWPAFTRRTVGRCRQTSGNDAHDRRTTHPHPDLTSDEGDRGDAGGRGIQQNCDQATGATGGACETPPDHARYGRGRSGSRDRARCRHCRGRSPRTGSPRHCPGAGTISMAIRWRSRDATHSSSRSLSIAIHRSASADAPARPGRAPSAGRGGLVVTAGPAQEDRVIQQPERTAMEPEL